MKRKLCLVAMLIGLLMTNGYCQKLKLRITSGYFFPITSFSYRLGWPETLSKPNPNNDFVFGKTPIPPATFIFPYLSFGLEWESKNKSHYELRYQPFEGVEYFFFFSWDDVSGIDSVSGICNIEKQWSWSGFQMARQKISFSTSLPALSYMIPVKWGGFQFHPMVGIAYMFVSDRNQEVDNGDYDIVSFYDRMYNDTMRIGVRETTIKMHTVQAFAGIHLRYYGKKREWASIFFHYEQGLFVTSALEYWVVRDHKKYEGILYNRGSALHLKLSVPIDIYRFKKERRKSD